MKNFLYLSLILILLSCNSDDEKSEADKLPDATQMGLNTVGCLVDGKAFLPDGTSVSTNCFYQFVNGKYYFYMSLQNSIGPDMVSIIVRIQDKQINQGETYSLDEMVEGNASGVFFLNLDFYTTNEFETGELKIIKFNQESQIVSGTFWFDIKDVNGNLHQIRDGRFDFTFSN